AVGLVLAATVPDTMMQHQNAAGLAHHLYLPDEVLIAGDVHFVDAAEVAAGHDQRTAHFQRDIVREVHDLDVEVHPGVDDGIAMHSLRLAFVGLAYMYGMMIEQRVRPDQAVDDALNFWHSQHFANGRWFGIALRQRRACRMTPY